MVHLFFDQTKQFFSRRKIVAFVLTIMLFPAFSAMAQNQTVSGTVSGTDGDPVPGAAVIVKGTTKGTSTDQEGRFSLANVPSGSVLEVSCIGMKTLEIPMTGKAIVDIILEEDTSTLDGAVAIGYGTIRKKDLTGAVASVDGEEISKKLSPQLSQSLQGSVAGLMVTRTSAFADQSSTIRVRGITTINDSDPLVIVDGIPGSIDDVNPNDVENITVLKDAASASIYGSRAAAGVILITTKRAKSGAVSLNYNMQYGFDTPTTVPQNETAVEYMRMYNEMTWNDKGNPEGGEYASYSKDLIDNYATLHSQNPDEYPDVDWMKVMLNDYAPRKSHVLNINAGTERIGTKISLAYDSNDALYNNRNFTRYTARVNNDIQINDFLATAIDFHFIRKEDRRPTRTFNSYVDFRFPAIYANVWTNGTYAPGTNSGRNYYPIVQGSSGYNNVFDNEVGGKFQIDFTPVADLKISAIAAPEFTFNKSKLWVKQVPYYNYDNPDVAVGYITDCTTTSLTEGRNDTYALTAQLLANYAKEFGYHRLNATAGFENYYYFAENMDASRDHYEVSQFPYLNLGPLEYRDNSGSAYEFAYRSVFGRMIYNFKNKYLLQVNARYDGSSRFNSAYRWGFFPSVSLGWVVSEEPFMKGSDKLSYLKLRASYGTLGNDRIGYYPYQSTVSFGSTLIYQGSSVGAQQTSYISKYAIPDISWETTKTYDIGADIQFFQNRLSITADYYKKITKDMLLAIQIPTFMGFSNPDQNVGDMYTRGWDLELGWKDSIGDLKYSVSFNLSDFKSVIGEIGGTEFLGSQVKFKGSEYNEWYGYLSDGIYQTEEEVANSAVVSKSVAPGDIKYKDISGPEGVPDGVISPEYDRTLLGGSLPRYLYGGVVKLDWKNMDFSMTFQGVGKQNAYLTYSMVSPRYAHYNLIDGQQWSAYNTEAENLKAKYPRYTTDSNNNFATSDFWIFNGAYFRLKNITLGYTLPSKLSNKVCIKGVRLYTSMSDLFSIDHYPDGYDPEGSNFFITKSFVFGLSLNF